MPGLNLFEETSPKGCPQLRRSPPPSFTQFMGNKELFKTAMIDYFKSGSKVDYFIISDLNRYGGDEGIEIIQEAIDMLPEERQPFIFLDTAQGFKRRNTKLAKLRNVIGVAGTLQKTGGEAGRGFLMVDNKYESQQILESEVRDDIFGEKHFKEESMQREMDPKLKKVLERRQIFIDEENAGGIKLETYLKLLNICSEDVAELERRYNFMTRKVLHELKKYPDLITITTPAEGQDCFYGILGIQVKGATRKQFADHLAKNGIDCSTSWVVSGSQEESREDLRLSLLPPVISSRVEVNGMQDERDVDLIIGEIIEFAHMVNGLVA